MNTTCTIRLLHTYPIVGLCNESLDREQAWDGVWRGEEVILICWLGLLFAHSSPIYGPLNGTKSLTSQKDYQSRNVPFQSMVSVTLVILRHSHSIFSLYLLIIKGWQMATSPYRRTDWSMWEYGKCAINFIGIAVMAHAINLIQSFIISEFESCSLGTPMYIVSLNWCHYIFRKLIS